MNRKRTVVLTLPGSQHIAAGMMRELNLEPSRFSKFDLTPFTGGELYMRVINDDPGCLRGKDVVLTASIHDHTDFFNVLLAQDLLVHKGVRRLFIAMPYLAYCTQEREVHPNDAVPARMIATQLAAGAGAYQGISRILLDTHTDGIQNYFPACHVPEVMQGKSILLPAIKKLGLSEGDFVVASADLGRPKWIASYANLLRARFALANKRRAGEHSETDQFVGGDFNGKDVVLYDDLTRSGRSAVQALNLYTENGATGGYLVLSHLAANNEAALQVLVDSPFKRIIVTDSHRWSQHPIVQDSSKFVVCETAPRLARRVADVFY